MSVAEPGRLAIAAARNPWLQPHRIVLMAVGAAIVGAAAVFMRWDWLPDYYDLALQGIWRTIWLLVVSCTLGLSLASPSGMARLRPSAQLTTSSHMVRQMPCSARS